MLPSKTFPANVYRPTTDSRKEEEKRKAKNAKARERAKTKKRKQRGDAGEEPPRKKSHRVSAGAVDSEGNPLHAGGSKDGGKVCVLMQLTIVLIPDYPSGQQDEKPYLPLF